VTKVRKWTKAKKYYMGSDQYGGRVFKLVFLTSILAVIIEFLTINFVLFKAVLDIMLLD